MSTLLPIPDYDPLTITYVDEKFGTDASGSPSETLNLAHLERVRAARRENEVTAVKIEAEQ